MDPQENGADTMDDRLWSLLENITRDVDRFDADAEGWCDTWLALLDYVVLVLVTRGYEADTIRKTVEGALESANEEEGAEGWAVHQIARGLTYADAPGPISEAKRVTISLPPESWQLLHTGLLLAALDRGHSGKMGMAKDLLEIAPKIHKAGGSELMDAAELEVRESLGVPA